MARSKDFDENEVLDKAIRVFWQKGYNGTSMQELVEALGISRSSLYETYIDKHTLFMRALVGYQKSNVINIRKLIADTSTAKETITKLLEFVASEAVWDEYQKGCFVVNTEVELAPHDKDVHALIISNQQELEDILYKVVKKGKDSGEIKSQQDGRALARFLHNHLKGMRVTAKSTSDKAVFQDLIKIALSIFDH